MAARATAVVFSLILAMTGVSAQLSMGFYSNSCPGMLDAVRSVLRPAIARERRVGASILRLFFHDCFVQGCDASLLLDDAPGMQGEKNAVPNINSAKGFDAIKAAVEKACPGVVSCADVLAVAAEESVVFLGGPSWEVKVGRRGSTTASFNGANNNIPLPTSGLAKLTSLFAAKGRDKAGIKHHWADPNDTMAAPFLAMGLSQKDMVALSGAHTIGLARCTNFRGHIYNDTDIAAGFARSHQSNCPRTTGSGDNNLAPLDLQTLTVFETAYYKNLVQKRALLHSDQELFNGGATDAQVRSYVSSQEAFFKDFVVGMIKMGSNGQIRKNRRRIN